MATPSPPAGYPQIDPFRKKIDGDGTDLFYRVGGAFYLVKANVFSDGGVELARIPEPVRLTMESLKQLMDDGIVQSEVPGGSRMLIHGYGEFEVGRVKSMVAVQDKYLEIQGLLHQLQGNPSA